MDVLQDGISNIELIAHMGTDESVVRAARVSYAGDHRTGVDKEGDAKLIRYLATHGHTSPFEHTALTFYVKCPLFVRSQWHRHRTWSYNEISRRYTSEKIEFYYPRVLRLQDTKNKQGSLDDYDFGSLKTMLLDRSMHKVVKTSVKFYNKLIKIGVAREQARMFLPQSLYTEFYATVDLHNLSHFIRLRSDPHAQQEIRVFSDAMRDIARDKFPISMEALVG